MKCWIIVSGCVDSERWVGLLVQARYPSPITYFGIERLTRGTTSGKTTQVLAILSRTSAAPEIEENACAQRS